ncbi:mannonate dehydratase [Alteromonas pelagimontana]|uniref:Mannonate dehydratase n=1 Tax=Alteromonas pelagimontana TaxID=1858656 RepID=A0A6M4MAH5_9ALTE|nr:mannonate dehydratase [Alteromonas pelagimontana]QJR80163.1 mannonate dehydratase [Alteromonas pelagimontana]
MIETWRWFGPSDGISLEMIAQAGAVGVVSSLHEIPTGQAWPLDAIIERKTLIEESGLEWSVIESIPLHNDIKTRTGNYRQYIDNYKQSVENAGRAGVNTICYNFMPVVDWTRTNLLYLLPNNSLALRFEMTDFVAYDIFILQREGAEKDYSETLKAKAAARLEAMSSKEKTLLEKNIIAGLPGGEGSYSRNTIKTTIEQFIALGTEGLRQNLFLFLQEIIPVAEQYHVKMCIHPDDPPFPLFGLPRVLSTQEDAKKLLDAIPSPANGLTLCAGSFGAIADNNLISMVKTFTDRIHFVHLRNVIREEDGSFYESDHLSGDVDMVGLISALLDVEKDTGIAIPMRPDHGHLLTAELEAENAKPGYSYLGRLKGLAELRGVMRAFTYNSNPQ